MAKLSLLDSSAHLGLTTPQTHPWRRRWFGSRDYWIAQGVGRGGFIALTLQSLANPIPGNTFVDAVCTVALGILTTHALRILLLVFRQRNHSWAALAPRIFGAWLAASLAMAGSFSLTSVGWLYADELAAGTLVQGERNLVDGWAAYNAMLTCALFFVGVWLSLYFGYHYYRQSRDNAEERLRLVAQVREAELRALKSQLKPHFLFNSLNTIRALIPRDLPAPRHAVTALSELLRAALRQGDRPLIPFRAEMELVDYFLALEQLRHEPRLRVRRAIDPATLDCEIPPLIVVTLVENAITHGIARRPEGGELVVTATRTGATFAIIVQNPGRICGDSDSHRVGLRNIRAQVALCFGPSVQFELTEDGIDTVTARLQVPCVEAAIPVAP